MPDTRAVLETILEIAANGSEPIPRQLLREWMSDEDLAVQGVCWEALLTSEDVQPRVTPPLTVDEVLDFGFRYFGRLLNESDEHREYAGLEIVDWFERSGDYSVWCDLDPMPPYPEFPGPAASQEALREWALAQKRYDEAARSRDIHGKLAAWLGEVYLGADENLRGLVSLAVIEPLINRTNWFWLLYGRWRNLAILGPALIAACHDEFFEVEFAPAREILTACCLPHSIPVSTLRGWLDSPDLELAEGAVDYVLHDETVRLRLDPTPTPDEVHEFYLAYYERCVKENPITEGWPWPWPGPRWAVMSEVLHWYDCPPECDDVRFLTRVRDWLAKLYIEGDEDTRAAIVCCAIEHILEQPRWRELFAPWRDHPVLAEAYGEAALWFDPEAMRRACAERQRELTTRKRPGDAKSK